MTGRGLKIPSSGVRSTPPDYSKWDATRRQKFQADRARRLRRMAARGLDARVRMYLDLRKTASPLMAARGTRKGLFKWIKQESGHSNQTQQQMGRNLERVNDLAGLFWEMGLTPGKKTPFPSAASQLKFLLFQSHAPVMKPADRARWNRHANQISVFWDGLGPHFLIPGELESIVKKQRPLQEDYAGLSTEVEIPRGWSKNRRGLLKARLPFSFTIEKANHRDETIEIRDHEKWHDFQRLERRMQPTLLDQTPGYLAFVSQRVRLQLATNWFQEELGATLAEIAQRPDYYRASNFFIARIQDYQPMAREKLMEAGIWNGHQGQWKRLFENMESTTQATFDILNSHFVDLRKRNPQLAVRFQLGVAELVREVPFGQLNRRLGQFAESLSNPAGLRKWIANPRPRGVLRLFPQNRISAAR